VASGAWQKVIDTNLTGAFLVAEHAIPHLRRASGAIVNIASTRARQSEPETTAYSASKGGMVALTHSLALSLGPAVRVNCIEAGWIATDSFAPRDERATPRLRRSESRAASGRARRSPRGRGRAVRLAALGRGRVRDRRQCRPGRRDDPQDDLHLSGASG
jgi:NAD(P)-dependent dehydrogenase (short-subunit alcohol dehydrogenase family)